MSNRTVRPGRDFRELFHRWKGNPILTATDWPYSVNTVFNPAATMYNNQVLLLARVEDRRGFSHFSRAMSVNGKDLWDIYEKPVLSPTTTCPEESWGVEDPRITYIEELRKYAVVYTGYSSSGPMVRLSLTTDFIHFGDSISIMPPEDKDAALFPKRIFGRWALIHRPIEHGSHIWISYSENLKDWGDHQVLLPTRPGSWWDSAKVGLCTPPLETKEGWLFVYHGVKQTAAGHIYRLGLALLDLQNPNKVLKRSTSWVFGPREIYEKTGDVPDVVFPCGWILNEKTDELSLYYGAADTSICLATAQMSDVLEYVMKCSNSYECL